MNPRRTKNSSVRQQIFNQFCGIFLAAILGCFFAVYIVGIDQINIYNNNWLWGDLFLVYQTWAQHSFDLNPECLFSDRFSFPLQMPLALFDSMPLFLLLFSRVSSFLPENSQYIGIYFVFCLILQGIFGYLAIREITKNYNIANLLIWRTTINLLGAIFFITIPFTFWRFQGHIALSSQWVIVLGLWLALRFKNSKNGPWIIANAGVVFLASGINPYLAIMVIATPLCFTLFDLISKHIIFWNAFTRISFVIAACGIGLYISGFTSAASVGIHKGYGLYSMNILGPLDSNGKAFLFPIDIPDATGGQTFEGFEYLGLGLVIMSVIAGSIAVYKNLYLFQTWLFSGLVIVVISYCFALSTTITLNEFKIIILPIPNNVLDLLSAFRASGRIFWIGGFWLILITFAVMIQSLPYRIAVAVISVITIIQLIDIAGVAATVRTNIRASERLRSKAAQSLPVGHYDTLIALPPWQCDPQASPGGIRGYEILGDFALQHDLKSNSFYAARILPEQSAYHCNFDNALNLNQPAWANTIYVLTNSIFTKYYDHLLTTHNCKYFDEYGGLNFCWPRISQSNQNINIITLHPFFLLGKNFYGWEGGIGKFVWSSGDADLFLENPNKVSINTKLHFEINALLPQNVIINLNSDPQNIKIYLKSGEPQKVILNLNLAPGKSKLQFITDKSAQLPNNGDPRKIAFSLGNFNIDLVNNN